MLFLMVPPWLISFIRNLRFLTIEGFYNDKKEIYSKQVEKVFYYRLGFDLHNVTVQERGVTILHFKPREKGGG